jgi:hypothetical protein
MAKRSDIAVSALTLCLLGGTLADRIKFHTPGPDAAPYQQRVRDAGDAMPMTVGNWAAKESDLPPAAIALLHPNLKIARHYENSQTGHSVEFLLIQCADVRDLLGHYPPRCYPANGYTQQSAELRKWKVGDLTINGTRYEFQPSRLQWMGLQVVQDFMLLPDGTTCPDMTGVDEAARDRKKKFFGGAHVQIVSDASLPEEERNEAFQRIIGSAMPLINQIRSGVKP